MDQGKMSLRIPLVAPSGPRIENGIYAVVYELHTQVYRALQEASYIESANLRVIRTERTIFFNSYNAGYRFVLFNLGQLPERAMGMEFHDWLTTSAILINPANRDLINFMNERCRLANRPTYSQIHTGMRTIGRILPPGEHGEENPS
jgi:hypothetical protein